VNSSIGYMGQHPSGGAPYGGASEGNRGWQLIVHAPGLPHLCLGTPRVVGAAERTLVAKNVKLHLASLLTVVTYDANLHVLVLDWHRRLCNLPVHFRPKILIPIQRDVANWATQGLQPCTRHLEFAQAVLVYGMTALQDGDLDC